MSAVDELEKRRKLIDEYDAAISFLLKMRFKSVIEISSLKKDLGIHTHQPSRERVVLRNVLINCKDKKFKPVVKRIYKVIIGESKRLQINDNNK